MSQILTFKRDRPTRGTELASLVDDLQVLVEFDDSVDWRLVRGFVHQRAVAVRARLAADEARARKKSSGS